MNKDNITLAELVVKGGKVEHEIYGDEINADTTLISWSMAKSITQALVGIAVLDGLLDIDQPTGLVEWSHDDRREITLRHLLEMRSGLSWVEDYVDGENSDVIDMLFGKGNEDTAAYAVSQPLIAQPGTSWVYSSGTTNIVSRILGNALGDTNGSYQNMLKFMQDRLFVPLGMKAEPRFDAAGTFIGSSYVYATARDFAKFGELYLRDGMVNGTRILPEGWVDMAGSQHSFDADTGLGYGHHWWTLPGERNSLVAAGYDGQYIMVIPDRDLVVVRLGKTVSAQRNAVVAHLRSLIETYPLTGGR